MAKRSEQAWGEIEVLRSRLDEMGAFPHNRRLAIRLHDELERAWLRYERARRAEGRPLQVELGTVHVTG